MSRRFLVSAGWLLAALSAGLASGCVERTYTILTTPPGAMVLENGHEVGPAPLTRHFDYYGLRRFDIVANGYQTLVVKENIATPWYEYFPLDFISENLIPWTIREHYVFPYTLEPIQVMPPEVLLETGQQLRVRGHTIGVPRLPPTPFPGAPGAPPGILGPPLAPEAGVQPPPGPARILPPAQPGPQPLQPVPLAPGTPLPGG